MGREPQGSTDRRVSPRAGKSQDRRHRLTELPRIATAEVVIHGVLKLRFMDGYEGVVDLRPFIAIGGVASWLDEPEHFADLKVEEFGHSISWFDESGYEIDIGADSLRRDCERQAAVHALMFS